MSVRAERIRRLYQRDELFVFMLRAIMDGRLSATTTTTTSVDDVERLRGLPAKRPAVVELFKSLERHPIALGRFIVGRRDSPSRFEWSFLPSSVKACAMGDLAEPERVADDEEGDEEEGDVPQPSGKAGQADAPAGAAPTVSFASGLSTIVITLAERIEESEAAVLMATLDHAKALIKARQE